MKRSLFGLLISLSITATSSAQALKQDRLPTLSIGPDMALPVGDFNTFHSIGFGGTAKFTYPLSARTALSATSGYLHFTGKDFTILTPGYGSETYSGISASVVPVKVGFIYDLKGGLYVEPQAGISFMSNGGGTVSGNGNTGFTYAANIGYTAGKLDFSMRYESIASYGGSSFIAFRAAYSFGIPRK